MKVTEGSSGPRILPDEGVHTARLVRIIDMGTQHNATYNKDNRQVEFLFELVDHKHVFNEEKGEEPFVISRKYTMSLNEKASLRSAVETWRGKALTAKDLEDGGFDIASMLGTAGQLQVVHKEVDDKVYANIGSLMACPKGMKISKAYNELMILDLDDIDNAVFEKLPEWMQKIIEESPEWQAPAEGATSDDLLGHVQ